MHAAVQIRGLEAGHWPEVEALYAAGIATGHATFEAEPPTWEQSDRSKLLLPSRARARETECSTTPA